MAGQENWPRKFGNAVDKLYTGSQEVKVYLKPGIVPVPPDQVADEIVQNAPVIDVVGAEVQAELRTSIWGGILTRVLERDNPKTGRKERCFQYLYLFTRQRGGVSLFWNIIVPFLALIFAFFSDLVFIDAPNVDYLTGFVFLSCIPLWLFPISQHYMDWTDQKKRATHIRGTTLLAPFGLLSPLTVIYHKAPLHDFYLYSMILYWFLILFLFICLVELIRCWLGRGWTCHKMDYAPIYLYQDDKGTLECVCWDYYHYNTFFEPEVDKIMEKGKVRLIMDNPWHSFSQKMRVNQIHVTLLGVLFMILGLVLGVFMFSLSIPILVAVGFLFFITGYIFFVQYPIRGKQFSNFQEPKKPGRPKNADSITDSKLVILWNLDDEKARLKITESLQDPFLFRETEKDSFNDIEHPPETTEVSELEEEPEEEEVAVSEATTSIPEPEEEVREPPREAAPPPDEDVSTEDTKRLKIDPSRRLGYRPEEEDTD